MNMTRTKITSFACHILCDLPFVADSKIPQTRSLSIMTSSGDSALNEGEVSKIVMLCHGKSSIRCVNISADEAGSTWFVI